MLDSGPLVDVVKDKFDGVVVGDVEVRVEADLISHLIPACEQSAIAVHGAATVPSRDELGSRGNGSRHNVRKVNNLSFSGDVPLCVPAPSHGSLRVWHPAGSMLQLSPCPREACVAPEPCPALAFRRLLPKTTATMGCAPRACDEPGPACICPQTQSQTPKSHNLQGLPCSSSEA